MITKEDHGMGWVPDLPDVRDYFPGQKSFDAESTEVQKFFEDRELVGKSNQPSSIIIPDNEFPPVEDQGRIGSCTANAAVGLMEYYQKRTKEKFIDMSRIFLYKATRNLMGVSGDTGAYLRTTMGAMRLFGSPPERFLPYDVDKFDEEPSAFLYSFAKEFQSVRYFRLDPLGTTQDVVLDRIKSFLNRKMPPMFGFTVYSSISQASTTGEIPYPCLDDKVDGGHAVVATGFDDNKEIENQNCGKTTKGALRIRNSWGKNWGNSGYGWLPYDYVLDGLARDWWSLIRNEWINTELFMP